MRTSMTVLYGVSFALHATLGMGVREIEAHEGARAHRHHPWCSRPQGEGEGRASSTAPSTATTRGTTQGQGRARRPRLPSRPDLAPAPAAAAAPTFGIAMTGGVGLGGIAVPVGDSSVHPRANP